MNDYTKSPEAGIDRAATPTEASNKFLNNRRSRIPVWLLGVNTILFGSMTALSTFGGSMVESNLTKAGIPPGILSQYPIEAVGFAFVTGFLAALTLSMSSGKTPEKLLD